MPERSGQTSDNRNCWTSLDISTLSVREEDGCSVAIIEATSRFTTPWQEVQPDVRWPVCMSASQRNYNNYLGLICQVVAPGFDNSVG